MYNFLHFVKFPTFIITAHDFLQKDKRINIRISSRDLTCLQKKTAKEGMPYQTLISSTLRKFVTGKLKNVE